MSIDWNEIFRLPPAALAGDKRIPKTVIVRQAQLTKREQKTLDKVKRLSLFATVQKSTTRILPYIDGSYDIESIVFLRCEMADVSAAFTEVSGLLHRCFPNPTVLLMEGSSGITISVALTRKSLAEKGAMVVEEQHHTGVLDPESTNTWNMLEALAFERLPQDNLLAYLREAMWRSRLVKASGTLGFYPECGRRDRERLVELLTETELLSREAAGLALARRDRELSLNEQMKLRVRLRGMEEQRGLLVAKVKELCGGRD